MPSFLYVTVLLACLCSVTAATTGTSRKVVVSGAGGQTGQHVFRKLLAREGFTPIGLVRSQESKQALLDTGVPAESVVVADIRNKDAVFTAIKGCDAVMICSSAKPAPSGKVDETTGRPIFGFPNGQPDEVDWLGQKNQIDAAMQNPSCHVVICSSMGGTDPSNMLNSLGRETMPDGSTKGGDILLWKRRAEMYLMKSGLPYTIVHPGGLINELGGERELVLTVDDEQEGTTSRVVPRGDVAEVMVQALLDPLYRGRSFDLRAKPLGEGTVTSDFRGLLASLGERNCDYSLGKIGEDAQ